MFLKDEDLFLEVPPFPEPEFVSNDPPPWKTTSKPIKSVSGKRRKGQGAKPSAEEGDEKVHVESTAELKPDSSRSKRRIVESQRNLELEQRNTSSNGKAPGKATRSRRATSTSLSKGTVNVAPPPNVGHNSEVMTTLQAAGNSSKVSKQNRMRRGQEETKSFLHQSVESQSKQATKGKAGQPGGDTANANGRESGTSRTSEDPTLLKHPGSGKRARKGQAIVEVRRSKELKREEGNGTLGKKHKKKDAKMVSPGENVQGPEDMKRTKMKGTTSLARTPENGSHEVSMGARGVQQGHERLPSSKRVRKVPGHEEPETVRQEVANEVVGNDGAEMVNQGMGRKSPSSREELAINKVSKGAIKADPGKGRKDQKPSLLDKMKAKLQGGQFRMLNEKLYTCRGEDAFAFFSQDPSSFHHYHTGYQEQTSHWPRLPVDVIIGWIRSRGAHLVVADFGCGDAKLAASVPNKVYSLDLVAANPAVIACNMAQTPLDSGCVDVAVFCLSLMGTDYSRFLLEARRVLKPGGWLLIAEVKSRFDPSHGGADPTEFLEALRRIGFEADSQDDSNKMFLMFYLRKSKDDKRLEKKAIKSIDWPPLKPCIYKRR